MHLYMHSLLACKEAGYTHEDKHAMWHALYDMYNIIFRDQDFGVWEERLAKICFYMAMESAQSRESENALAELEQMLVHIANKNKHGEVTHTSLLVNRITVDRNSIPKHTTESLKHSSLRYLTSAEENGVFDAIKDDLRYKTFKKELNAQ